eukprot:scaffold332_cov117-Cylindrotheca_fusiformis.AAC.27
MALDPVDGFSVGITPHRRHPTTTQLNAETKQKKKKKNRQGVYVRPSGAIERGSGFFVPGLEGPRVRLVVGLVLLLLTGVNRITSPSTGFSFEEIVAIFYSLLVLLQAVIEFGKEELIVEGSSSPTATAAGTNKQEEWIQQWTTALTMDDEYKSKVQWAATSYLSVTPASELMLLQGGESNDKKTKNIVAYRLGATSPTTTTTNDENESSGIEAALEQLRQSKGGRISLPLDHPAAALIKGGTNDPRCVVLQRITDDSCWMMKSDQLLASFTSSDLKWLGQMAAYVRDT